MSTVGETKGGPRGLVIGLGIRALALLDALALPALLGWWVWSWHSTTPGVRLLLGFLVAYWAAKRAYAATVGFHTFKWRLTRLAVAALAVWVVTRLAA